MFVKSLSQEQKGSTEMEGVYSLFEMLHCLKTDIHTQYSFDINIFDMAQRL